MPPPWLDAGRTAAGSLLGGAEAESSAADGEVKCCPLVDRRLSPDAPTMTVQDTLEGALDQFCLRQERIVGAGHCIHRDRFDAAVRAVAGFLRGAAAKG